jgi:hypothetical protein
VARSIHEYTERMESGCGEKSDEKDADTHLVVIRG